MLYYHSQYGSITGVKGTVNEMNVGSIIEGEPVIIRSRVDENRGMEGNHGKC